MQCFSYVVRWDHGFAPNPFFGICTLATCKPAIRKNADIGDLIVGTGGAKRGLAGQVIFLLRISRIISFDDYWTDPQFEDKKPIMNGSLEQRFGDNIYHRNAKNKWVQADSRHSKHAGSNPVNLKRDTGTTDHVLIAQAFTYWGEKSVPVPRDLRKLVIQRPGWAELSDKADLRAAEQWFEREGTQGRVGDPAEWKYQKYWR